MWANLEWKPQKEKKPTVEWNNKKIQDTKIGFIKEIESLKKSQNKVNLEMKNAES